MHFSLPTRITNSIDRSGLINSNPFDPNTSLSIPQGKYTCVHYGIMIPNLPEPFNFLNLIVVVGQPLVKLFRNDHLIKTSAIDTANVLIGTATGTPEHFNGYSVEKDCTLVSNGSYLKFGNDLVIEGKYPDFHAYRVGHNFNFDLKLRATDKIAHFVKMMGGMYEHWALLCEYEGFVEQAGVKIEIKGLCTYEYARGINVNVPIGFFTYQILNIDDKIQVLFVDTFGPLGVTLQSRVYVRSVDDHGGIYSKGFKSIVHEYEPERVTNPDGISMRLPHKFSWQVNDDKGNLLIQIQGITNRDFKYGMAGGYAGSYQYNGIFRGKTIEGKGYIEYIDPQ
ncbi:DUF6670 family protein [Acinetobacter tjernbergiae]|uniref:AttH domain-containing protein n=1 Tax=Acinetobacter tjernbergiae DSM 14971 = CIP 107465 TaxID=1120928 RepID=V2UFP9_9GAMM|nr:DUF6670 family protein [Acinetobacter tjernbergiae]ESK53608.1 hypothetical protein F990_03283 [Acinetobacter tjernbergiae DSM 14971 = CIP 107465]